ncbi:MAG: glycosyltransferase family 4 protein, partial [bacterium]
EFQKRILKERFKKNSIIIKNGLIIPKVTCEINNNPIILWVASIRSIKRPNLFIELAKSIPNAHFEMVGGKVIGETLLYEKIRMAAKKVPNLRFHGFVPYYNVNEYFNRASIFVNTSIIEGFPNTFIQAWMHNTPVVSLNVDPDKIIQNKKLGFFSGTFEQMVLDLKILLEDETLRKAIGKNARKYVEKEHNIKKTVKKYIEVFNEIL